jgi:hypothetical protein
MENELERIIECIRGTFYCRHFSIRFNFVMSFILEYCYKLLGIIQGICVFGIQFDEQ